jgi:hypothetical protein
MRQPRWLRLSADARKTKTRGLRATDPQNLGVAVLRDADTVGRIGAEAIADVPLFDVLARIAHCPGGVVEQGLLLGVSSGGKGCPAALSDHHRHGDRAGPRGPAVMMLTWRFLRLFGETSRRSKRVNLLNPSGR